MALMAHVELTCANDPWPATVAEHLSNMQATPPALPSYPNSFALDFHHRIFWPAAKPRRSNQSIPFAFRATNIEARPLDLRLPAALVHLSALHDK